MTNNSRQTDDSTEDPTEEKCAGTLHAHLLERLICPLTHGPLTYNKDTNMLISEKAGLAFPVKNGIPLLLEEEALPLD